MSASKDANGFICLGAISSALAVYLYQNRVISSGHDSCKYALLAPIKNRRSRKLIEYSGEDVDEEIIWSLLNAAMWAPYHGNKVPWRFVVLGKEGMQSLQDDTRYFYEQNWETVLEGDEEKRDKILEKMERS